ncbi:MAG TPA: hypothetical protein VK629_04950 [Steroidobacteraceae bacterium]|nr:hypothetical protein [Steroidobacteraceae bacterium]
MQRVSLPLLQFFHLLDTQFISYSVLGDTDSLPEEVTSDVDIVVPDEMVARMPALIDEFCRCNDLRLVQCLQHEHNAYYFVVASRGDHQFLAIDICGHYVRRSRKYLRAEELLTHAVPALSDDGTPRHFMICSPAYEFCYYLIKKIDKQDLQPRHCRHLTRHWHLDPTGSMTLIERFWGKTVEARLLAGAADSGDWSTVGKLLPRLRAVLHQRVPLMVVGVLRELTRRLSRWRRPTGLLIGVLGPDGSGKSSIIAAAERRVREAFRQTTIVHLRPGFLYRPDRAPTRTPHADRPRSRGRSFAKLLYFAGDYVLGYWFSLRSLLVRSNGVLFDRYYDDILADPIRYRHTGSMKWVRRLRAFVPRPDLWILLDAPTAVLQSRKQEVSSEETERQRHAYRELLEGQQHVAIIDASAPLTEVVTNAADAILQRCELQTRARLRLSGAGQRSPLAGRWLLFCCRHRIPLISKLMRVIFNADIYCAVPRDLYLPHPYGIVIHSRTRLGRGVTIMQQVTLGGKDLHHNVAPIVGDNVYIGAGARVLGAVRIGDGAMIGANTVVTRDVPAGARVVGVNRILDDAPAAKLDIALPELPHSVEPDPRLRVSLTSMAASAREVVQ